jgi:hypothetical protein
MVLAIPESASQFFKRRIAKRLFETQKLIVVVNVQQEVIVEWLPQVLS